MRSTSWRISEGLSLEDKFQADVIRELKGWLTLLVKIESDYRNIHPCPVPSSQIATPQDVH